MSQSGFPPQAAQEGQAAGQAAAQGPGEAPGSKHRASGKPAESREADNLAEAMDADSHGVLIRIAVTRTADLGDSQDHSSQGIRSGKEPHHRYRHMRIIQVPRN